MGKKDFTWNHFQYNKSFRSGDLNFEFVKEKCFICYSGTRFIQENFTLGCICYI